MNEGPRTFHCPECDKPLSEVKRPSGHYLNEDQYDSTKAGDFCCETCKGDRGKSGFRYYWRHELVSRPSREWLLKMAALEDEVEGGVAAGCMPNTVPVPGNGHVRVVHAEGHTILEVRDSEGTSACVSVPVWEALSIAHRLLQTMVDKPLK